MYAHLTFRQSVCWHFGIVATLDAATFLPTPTQQDILAALDGRALRTDALAHRADCNRRSLFHDPGGLPELQRRGLVAHHRRIGFYRPDAPPPELGRAAAAVQRVA
jgi:hypothetical protein